MMNPTMVTREVGRTIDRDRVRRAESFRASRRSRAHASDTSGSNLATATRRREAGAFTLWPWSRRRAATTAG